MLSVIQPYTAHTPIIIHTHINFYTVGHVCACSKRRHYENAAKWRKCAWAHNEIKRQHYSHFFNTSWKSGNKAS